MVLSKEEREKKRKRRKRKTASIITILILLIGGAIFCCTSKIFNVEDFVISGNSYYTSNDIKTMGNMQTGNNIFVKTDYKDIEERLLRDTYIKDVVIEKELPNKVHVTIDERIQMAYINYGTNYLVLDSEGIYLRKTDILPELTRIEGLTLNGMELGNVIGVDEDIKLDYMLDVLKAMYENDMFFSSISMNESTINANVLEHLVCVGTSDNIVKALENRTLQATVSKLLTSNVEYGTLKITDNSSEDGIVFSPIIDGE